GASSSVSSRCASAAARAAPPYWNHCDDSPRVMSAFDLQIQEDGLGVLTFDRPGEKVNTFSWEVFEEFAEVLPRLAREPRLCALLVRSGKPDNFIAGADVKE